MGERYINSLFKQNLTCIRFRDDGKWAGALSDRNPNKLSTVNGVYLSANLK